MSVTGIESGQPRESELLASTVSPFSYFSDGDGYIFIAKGPGFLDGTIQANLVYSPDEEGNKFNTNTGTRYLKGILDGSYHTPINVRSDQRVSPHASSHIERYMQADPHSSETAILIPSREISHVYDPKSAFRVIVEADDWRGDAARYLSGLLESVGVPIEELGVFGGMLVGIENLDGSTKDMDIVLYGRDYLSLIKRFSSEQLREFGLKRKSEGEIFSANVSPQKLSNTRYANFFTMDDFEIEVRLARKADEPPGWVKPAGNRVSASVKGRVIDDSDTVTLPMALRVDVGDRVLHVQSNVYQMLGAAYSGDLVEVTGDSFENDVILVHKPDHQIQISKS